MKEPLHFTHGNGFPSGCYKSMLNFLADEFDCYCIDKVGHSVDFPITDNWQNLVEEVITSIQLQTSTPVIAVGHSLGGILSFCAAITRPELIKAVIMLDSPILGRFKSAVIQLAKFFGVIDHLTPASRTRGRRDHWQTREELLSYLKTKPLFKSFSSNALEDYINYGTEKDNDGYYLRFNPEVEYKIYRTIPHVLYEYKSQLSKPAAVIYGTKSNVIKKTDLNFMQTHFHIKNYPISGTHMFPMEYPKQTAELIIKIVNSTLKSKQ